MTSAATALFLSALLDICVAILLAGKRRREKVAEERARIEAKEAEIEREWASVFVHKSNQ